MRNSRHLTVAIVGAMAVALLLASSAFADSRHQSWTRHGSGHGSHGSGHGSHGSGHGSSGGHFFSHSSPGRSFHSGPTFRGSTWRGGAVFHGGRGVPFGDGRRFFGRGRIERIVPFHGGYHVFLGGWGYPFFVPYRFWDPFRFRLGLFIGFPAYWDPYGYYTVYGPYGGGSYYGGDGGYYGGGYNGGGDYRADVYDRDDERISSIGGIVRSVDLNSGIVVIEDNRTGRTITALLPPRDRRVDDIRPGDSISLSGDWVRGRRYDFDASRLDRFDSHR